MAKLPPPLSVPLPLVTTDPAEASTSVNWTAIEPRRGLADQTHPGYGKAGAGRVRVRPEPLAVDDVVQRCQDLPRSPKSGRSRVTGNVTLLEMPVVDVDLDRSVAGDFETLEGLQ